LKTLHGTPTGWFTQRIIDVALRNAT